MIEVSEDETTIWECVSIPCEPVKLAGRIILPHTTVYQCTLKGKRYQLIEVHGLSNNTYDAWCVDGGEMVTIRFRGVV